MTAQGTAALFNRSDSCRVRSAPQTGCVEWQRAPDTDDEDGRRS